MLTDLQKELLLRGAKARKLEISKETEKFLNEELQFTLTSEKIKFMVEYLQRQQKELKEIELIIETHSPYEDEIPF